MSTQQCSIQMFIHCANCLPHRPRNVSPKDWSRTQVGWTSVGFEVWCNRCNMSVGHFDCRKIQVTQIPETFTPPPPSGNINPTVKLPGTDIDVTVASAEDCENVDFVVCVLYNEASASGVPQMESYCMDCKQRVCRDARGPQKPPSICIDCAIKRTPPDNQSLTE